MYVCSACGNDWKEHPVFPCVGGKKIPAEDLMKELLQKWPLEPGDRRGDLTQIIPVDLSEAMEVYRELTESDPTFLPRRRLFADGAAGPSRLDLAPRWPRRLPPLPGRLDPLPARRKRRRRHRRRPEPPQQPEPPEQLKLPAGLAAELQVEVGSRKLQELRRQMLVREAFAKWRRFTLDARHERAALIRQLHDIAEKMTEELKASKKFKANETLNKSKRIAGAMAPPLPIVGKLPLRESHLARPIPALEESLSLTGMSDSEVVSLATTGRWASIAPRLEMGFTLNEAKDAIGDARELLDQSQRLAENIDTQRQASSQREMAEANHPEVTSFQSDPHGFLERILTVSFGGYGEISPTDLVDFRPVVTAVLGKQFLDLIGSSIPFLSTIVASYHAAKEGKKAFSIHKARKKVRSGLLWIRPGTPGIAASAVIKSLKHYRLLHGELCLMETANAIGSLFDGGLVSGPTTSLAKIAVRIYELYRAFKELLAYQNLMGASEPYKALKASGTMGAYVIINYPAVGLIDPRLLTDATLQQRTKTVLKFFSKKQDPEIKQTLKKIREGSLVVLKESPLQVGPSGSLQRVWRPAP